MLQLITGLLLLAFTASAQTNRNFKRTEDVIYGHKSGMALTIDVFQPEKPNGLGIILVVSGGWFSAREAIVPQFYQPFVDHGYSVFAVVHGSQPKFQITEILQDMHRAVRFIRFNAKKFGIDPNHLGVTGGSAGGHLSLMLATRGGPGTSDAKDPIDRESSAVQCVACFFPPTDFLNYGDPGTNAVGIGILRDFKSAFGPVSETEAGREKLGKELSPIYYVHSNQPPILIIHGDMDKLVPFQQSETFVEASKRAGAEAKLVVKKGGAHGWNNWLSDFAQFVDWFDEQLRKPDR